MCTKCDDTGYLPSVVTSGSHADKITVAVVRLHACDCEAWLRAQNIRWGR